MPSGLSTYNLNKLVVYCFYIIIQKTRDVSVGYRHNNPQMIDQSERAHLFGYYIKNVYPCLHFVMQIFQSIIEAAQQKDIQDMLNELEVMKSMQPHPHVVRLIGCCTEKGTGLI